MVSEADVHALADAVTGPVTVPGDPGYADDALAFNLAVQHSPDVVLGATDADDVAAGVRWAAGLGLPVAVQATGHGASDAIDGGLLICTRRMQDVVVDPVARTAHVGAGVKWRDVLAASVPLGLIGLNGSSTDVGVVGYTLGGGLPVLGRAFGFAADHVHSFEVVTPDGEARHVDAETHPELFSALRGGTGSFAIVTSMVCGLLPLAELYGGGIMFPGADAAAVLSAFGDWWPTLPETAAPSIALLRLPDLEFVPEPLRGQFVVHLRFAFIGGASEGEALLAPMRQVSTPLMDAVGPMNYRDIDMVHMDPVNPTPFEDGGVLLRHFDEAAQEALLELAGAQVESPLLMVELRPLGGRLVGPPAGADSVSGRDAAFSLIAIGLMAGPVAAVVPAAIHDLLQAMEPYATGGTMVNFHGRPGDAADRARAWSPEIYARLSAAKTSYDPTNMLRFGHGIPVGP
ncbi:FAD/FMN-containing dehydrogenase [Sanguibacter gelidistatuariae]|uniref:FAD/FMN-containing dehydrogenase n=1 Tax=Sanguibacter gelidistatuariae TaxID=1814289 RepID=A0A1G6S1P7_9MICO|nr:FAD-binding oxidoreductase [Sanguibacter gelidistatuariae]SDD10842.1 FAD/FMN-containing dehydrogenase [Sanguibacter gelidistatuariae]